MQIAFKLLLIISSLVLLASCAFDEEKLQGKWQAAALYENGKSVDVPLEEVQLEFGPDQAYRFTSVGFYEEKGYFRSSVNYLFMTDTTTNPHQEHVVKVLYLSDDSLKLRMVKDSVKQALFLVKM